MQAVTLIKNGNPYNAFEIREIEAPKIEKDDVLIKVEAFGLNFADVMARLGLYDAAPPIPSVLGYDVVGEVVEAGSESGKHLIGKRVVAMTLFGGYAEYAKTDFRACAEIPATMSPAVATALATQYCTAYVAAYELINLHEGDKILIHAAAGGVGTAISQLAKLKGCEIFGLTSRDHKMDYLTQNGVDHPINYTKSDYAFKILEITNGKKIDVAFNSVGGSTFKKDRSVLGKGGRQVIYGVAEMAGTKFGIFSKLNVVRKFGFYSPIQFLINSQAIIGLNMLEIALHKKLTLKRALEAVVRLTKKGDLNPVQGGEFFVNDIGKAHEFLESRKSIGKIVVKWD